MPEKEPPVFLDYDQAALDAAYDQAAYAPNREQLIKRRIRDSELARHRVYTKAIAAEAGFGGKRLELFRFATAGKRSKTTRTGWWHQLFSGSVIGASRFCCSSYSWLPIA